MKFVTWNCNGKFREKYKAISRLDADVYVIQECEDPEHTNAEDYRSFAVNHLWIGDNKNKGLGIFAVPSIELRLLDWETDGLSYFLPCRINGAADVVGVWAMRPYTKQYLDFQTRNYHHYSSKTIALGDFNSNAQWDAGYSAGTYAKFVSGLAVKGIVSAYHHTRQEKHGEEQEPTFYLYRKENRAYHMDYCFCGSDRIRSFWLGSYEEWSKYSDHMPLLTEIDIS